MNINAAITVGKFLCLFHEFGRPDWNMSCIGSYEACVRRAKEFEEKSDGTSILIVQIAAIATPAKELIWTSTLTEKIKT